MPENVNTSALDSICDDVDAVDNRPVVIDVDHVSMSFNMASEQLNSLKEYMVSIVKRQLFFEEFKALDDVSFKVRKGDVFGIMGTNGSGKSTMLKIIAGVLEPTKGKCEVRGNIAPLIELGAGFDMDLSARENIYLNGALLGYSKSFIDEHFDAIVEFAEVEKFLDMPMKNYSSGMVARIAFAIATVIVPEILVVDEVLSVGDFMFQKKCENRIMELIEQHGVTVLIVSHSNDQISRLCNKAIWIEKGHERIQGDAESVCRAYSTLGGRIGSASSEKRVYGALMSGSNVEEDIACVWGADLATVPSETSGLTMDGEKVAVLACENTHVNALVAAPFASSLGVPVQKVAPERLSSVAEKAVLYSRPDHVFIFDCGSQCEGLLTDLAALPWSPKVDCFNGGVTPMSLACFDYGKQRSFWSPDVALVAVGSNVESRVVAPFLYSSKTPVIMFWGDDNGVVSSTPLAACSFETAYLLGGSEEVEESLRSISSSMHSFKGDPWDVCLELSSLFASKASNAELCIASFSLDQWPDLLSLGSYAGSRSGIVLLSDELNLDHIADVLDFISSYRSHFKGISFAGKYFSQQDSEQLIYLSEFAS